MCHFPGMWEQGLSSESGLKEASGRRHSRVLWGVWELPHASHLPAQQSDVSPFQKAGCGGPVLLGSQEYRLIMAHWDRSKKGLADTEF